jgi:hypothetical protein
MNDDAQRPEEETASPELNRAHLITAQVTFDILHDADLNHFPPQGDTVAHYTDAAGMVGIIGSRQLWLTDAMFTNDRAELAGAESYFEDADTWIREYIDGDEELSTLPQITRDAAARGVSAEFARRKVGEQLGAYMMCFCEDGDRLSQWRGYGNFGGGYSIELDANELQMRCAESRGGIMLMRVVYDEAERLRLARLVIASGMKHLYINIMRGDIEAEEVYSIIGRCIAFGAEELALRFKDRAWSEEEEWRLTYRQVDWLPQLKRLFRATAKGIMPYVSVRTDGVKTFDDPAHAPRPTEFTSLPIRGVTLGPMADPERAERSVRYLLADSANAGVPITRSKIPLR